MKIVINRDFGGFEYPEKFCAFYNLDPDDDMLYYDDDDEFRFNGVLIKWLEKNPQDCEGLRVVDIPDNATDWQIFENDGFESILYVVDGKMKWAK